MTHTKEVRFTRSRARYTIIKMVTNMTDEELAHFMNSRIAKVQLSCRIVDDTETDNDNELLF